MAASNISLAPGLGYGLAIKERSPAAKSTNETPATDNERNLAFQAVDFFITECKLGASLLARRLGWRDDVKSMVRYHRHLTRQHLECLAEVLELSLDQLLDIGANPPLEWGDVFRNGFIELGLVVNNKHFAKATFI